MNDSELLLAAKKWKKINRVEPVKLGDTITGLMKRITPLADRFGKAEQYWDLSIPEHMRGHCRIGSVSGGTMEVFADSPSYLYELRLCSRQIISDLRENCPAAKIKNIKFVAGSRF